MIRIQLPHRFAPLAAVGIALALTSARGADASPALPDAASARGAVQGTSWFLTWSPSWLPAEGAAVSSHMPGLRVTLDPITRRPVTPTAEQRRALSGAPEPDEYFPVERLPGGGELVHLNGRYMVFSVARRDASGRFRTDCVTDSVNAVRVLSTPIPPRPVPAKRQWEEK